MPSSECPKCSGKMEEGFTVDRGRGDAITPSEWVEGVPERSFWSGTKTRGKAKYRVATFRCRKCGYLESYARPSE